MNKITLQGIKTIVTRRVHINLSDNIRKREYVYARAIYFKLAKEFPTHSYKDIGSLVGRDHASVIHGLKVFDMLTLYKDNMIDIYLECKKILNSVKSDLMESDDAEYWKIKYETMKEAYVNVVKSLERLTNYEKEELG